MLFEFSIAKKYLVPKKKQLSLSLISLMSVGVISLVVWLILVFLSVTDGIEKNWLKKLTSFNAPIQITPTDAYYQSYYYQVDSISGESEFTYKSIGEKAAATLTDPYNPEEDLALPSYWPDREVNADGTTMDFVKLAFSSIEGQNIPLIAQDYEVSGALLKLRMLRPQGPSFAPQENTTQSYLTQASYINSFSDKSPHLHSLIDPPRIEDLNHLFYLAELSPDTPTADQPDRVGKGSAADLRTNLASLLENITIKRMRSLGQKASYLGPILPENQSFDVIAYKKQGRISYLVFSDQERKKSSYFEKGTVKRQNDKLIFASSEGKIELSFAIPLFLEETLSMEAKLAPYILSQVKALQDLKLDVRFTLQGQTVAGTIPWESLEIEEAIAKTSFDTSPHHPPPWTYQVGEHAVLPQKGQGAAAVLLPKNFQANGVKIGDTGYFSYNAATASAIQEQRLPVFIAGFYDPGVMAIGARMILTEPDVVHTINTSSQTYSFDQNMMNGIQVWFSDLSKTAEVQKELTDAFNRAGILPYWKITPYYDYDFAKDLLMQFQSDKYLFTLIGIIVLIVACSNIISLLVILVNDKKKEIAILSAMGASKKSIAWIFTLCGGIMGCFSTLIGTAAALLTIHNIDAVVHFLSFLQGHDAFNAVFYGKSLPSELSERALMFILIATPIISLLAGLVPALKASKVHPSKILRSE
jgi:lipoprotein-releasing system permease protein